MGKNTSRYADAPVDVLKQAAMASPWGFAITERQRTGNHVLFVNQAFEFLSGHKAAEILGKSWHFLVGRNPDSHSLEQLEEAVRQGSHCSVMMQKTGEDGSVLRTELTVAPVIDLSGDVTHLTWQCRDLSSHIEREERLEAAIAEKEERFSSYVENASEAIWRIDFKPPIPLDIAESQQVGKIFQHGIFQECNDAGARIYGLKNGKEVIGKYLNEFMEPSNPENVRRVTEYARNRFRMKNLVSYERDAHGTMHAVVNNITPCIKNGRLQYIWGTSLDVSEQFETLQALEQSQKELAEKAIALEEKNTALRELIANIELDKKDFKDRITANIEQVILPSLDRIRLKSDDAAYVEQHRQALEDLTSAFGRRITDVKNRLTPREIEVCNLVKNGLTSKEIAILLKVAIHTVEKHRRMARKKLNLANKGINLQTYLNSL
jgi:PAS domain S-box-containing protein